MKDATPPFSAETLRELITYEPDTGLFRWRISRGRAGAGKIAGCADSAGYIRIYILGRKQAAHRLAWLYMTGEWPVIDVDHKDTVKSNNRWSNLRLATRSQNSENQRGPKANNRSGYLGVHFHKRSQKYVASITVRGKRRQLGEYRTGEEAYAVYLAAKRELHTHCTL